jgi:transposase-like protein
VILCTDDYTIYDDIDEYDGIDAHLTITHDDTYVIGDAHVNSCENRHSFLRQWLAKFRGVSKHHLQGYLNVFGLLPNDRPTGSTRSWVTSHRDERVPFFPIDEGSYSAEPRIPSKF